MNVTSFKMEDCRHYINLIQNNINRMASNSANCKTWTVSIVSALLAVQAALRDITFIVLYAILPIVLFFFLDSYYLGLEKRFIKLETDFVKLVKLKEDISDVIYILNPQRIGTDSKFTWEGMKSYSTWPFYGILLFFVCAIFLYNHKQIFSCFNFV